MTNIENYFVSSKEVICSVKDFSYSLLFIENSAYYFSTMDKLWKNVSGQRNQ